MAGCSFIINDKGFFQSRTPEKDEPQPPNNRLQAFRLLRNLTGIPRGDVSVEHAYLKLGQLRAINVQLREFNESVEQKRETALAACCRFSVVDFLSGVGFSVSQGELVDLEDTLSLESALEARCIDRIQLSRERIAGGRLEFLDLAEFYKPGDRVIGPAGSANQEMGYKVLSCGFDEENTLFGKKHSCILQLEFVASVGDRFAMVACQERVGWWRGLRPNSSLFFQPLSASIEEQMAERGKLYAEVATGIRCFRCQKGAFMAGSGRHNASFDDRVMVDVATAMESGQAPTIFHADAAPNALSVMIEQYRKAVRQGRLEKKDPAVLREEALGVLFIDRMSFLEAVPEERLWNTWPFVLAYSFASKVWGHAEVSGLSPIVWEEKAWDMLVLPPRRKALIRAVVERQREVGSVDVIKGKGEGTTFLLYGPPGTGKTLTAEALAEALHKPLYVLSAGELGTTPAEFEKTLAGALHLCHKWDCLCLIDEADIFIEERKANDVLRNALVCVLLRLLEYHPGVLFMTSNKVKGIDAAVQSRLTLALRYEALDEAARQEVWKTLLQSVGCTENFDCVVLARKATNGRQIKNCLCLAMTLALSEGQALTQEVLEDVLAMAATFQEDLQ